MPLNIMCSGRYKNLNLKLFRKPTLPVKKKIKERKKNREWGSPGLWGKFLVLMTFLRVICSKEQILKRYSLLSY